MSEKENNSKKNMGKRIRIALICVFGAVFVVSAAMFVSTLIGYHRSSDIYDDIHDSFIGVINKIPVPDDSAVTTDVPSWTRPSADTTTSPVIGDETTLPPTPDDPGYETEDPDIPYDDPIANETEPVYSEQVQKIRNFIFDLQKVNKDVFGYIYIKFNDSEIISYPVTRGKDNEFYMTHAYDGSSLRAGSIFLDHRCHLQPDTNKVTLLYGHNMVNGAMFHNLLNYKEKEYFDNVNITLYTLDGIYTYKVFSAYNAMSDESYGNIYFKKAEEYLSFLNNAKAKSQCKSDITLTPEDTILTLSTCLNTTTSARFAVHAVLVGIVR